MNQLLLTQQEVLHILNSDTKTRNNFRKMLNNIKTSFLKLEQIKPEMEDFYILSYIQEDYNPSNFYKRVSKKLNITHTTLIDKVKSLINRNFIIKNNILEINYEHLENINDLDFLINTENNKIDNIKEFLKKIYLDIKDTVIERTNTTDFKKYIQTVDKFRLKLNNIDYKKYNTKRKKLIEKFYDQYPISLTIEQYIQLLEQRINWINCIK